MGRCYSHVSTGERDELAVMKARGMSVSEIARALHRDKSTVSRELKRNSFRVGAGACYRSITAQGEADARRALCRRPKLMDDPERRRVAVGKIADDHWSPEQVEHRLAAERPDLAVSDATIYRAVDAGDLDCELPGHRRFRTKLRRRGKRRRKRGHVETRARSR